MDDFGPWKTLIHRRLNVSRLDICALEIESGVIGSIIIIIPPNYSYSPHNAIIITIAVPITSICIIIIVVIMLKKVVIIFLRSG